MSLRDLEQNHADLSKIPCLEPNRLVGFVNHFAASLVQQLSHLNDAADQRLFRIHSRIRTCKTNLLILEKKLTSVDGLSAALPHNPVVQVTPHVPDPDVSSVHDDRVHEEEANDDTRDFDVTDHQVEADIPAADPHADDELQRFYKMLKVGVPLPAVRMKMISEGMDPDRLKI